MLDDITAKVWRILPVVDVPRSWVITYCMKYTEIYQDVETSAMRCRHDGTDWDCTFIELVIQICLKNTLLLEKLHVHINDCNNYPCMFSKIIEGERMKSLVSIIQNDTMDNARQEFKQCIHDCTVWWKLFKHFNKDANPRRELGRCLFQTFSSKCREPVLYKMQLLLTDTAET
ncbi:uncharacterized protein LOC143377848 isoform X1 [Andrena cerasifolii]|uniref:uncharacterized protein LOC143377848 isoform X1 n=1 Tax=Andrena cerasifolii TaxID=2819439 RepID=UPI004037CD73